MDEKSKPKIGSEGNNGNNDKDREQVNGDEDMDFGDDLVKNDKSGKKTVSIDELEGHNKQLLEELEQKKTELAKTSDKMMRAQADFENYKKLISKERKDYEFYVKQRVFRSILDVAEDLTRAITAMETNAETISLGETLKGVKMIHEQLENLLSNENIKTMDTVGKDFDPMKHDVLFIEEKEEYEDNKIMEEFQKGYMLGSKVLRAAKVKVSKKGKKAEKKEDNEETSNKGTD